LVSDGSWKYRVHDPAGKETAEVDMEAIYKVAEERNG
jgi:hypothetical protein